MDAQRILGVSLTTAERVAVSAAYDGTTLVIGRLDIIDGNLFTWRKKATERVQEAVANGASVFVEEMGEAVSEHAHGILLSDVHPVESRPILAVALDWYFSMLHSGALVFAPGTERGRITETAVDMTNDDRGRNVYRVDWSRVKGAHRAVLLCCLAAEGMQPVSEHYINELFGGVVGPDGQDPNPLQRMARAMHDWDVERERQMQIAEGRIEL